MNNTFENLCEQDNQHALVASQTMLNWGGQAMLTTAQTLLRSNGMSNSISVNKTDSGMVMRSHGVIPFTVGNRSIALPDVIGISEEFNFALGNMRFRRYKNSRSGFWKNVLEER